MLDLRGKRRKLAAEGHNEETCLQRGEVIFEEKRGSAEGFEALDRANRAGDGPDRCDGLGVVPVRATRASAITGPAATATAATIDVVVQGAVHRQRRDRSRGYGADVLLREPRQVL